MKKCLYCKDVIKDVYSLCYLCWRKKKSRGQSGVISEPIKANDFMESMGISSWSSP